MIIELFGLPGSGKTTLSRGLAQDGRFELIKIRNKKDLLFYNFLFLIKHPIKFFVTLFYVISNSSLKDFYYKFTNCFLHQNAKYQKALKAKNAVLDQGYFQNFLSIFERPISAASAIKYFKYLLFPDKLIILDLSVDALQSRLTSRGWAPRQNLGRDYFENWMKAVKDNYDLVLRLIPEFGIDYLIVDATRPADEVYNEINKI